MTTNEMLPFSDAPEINSVENLAHVRPLKESPAARTYCMDIYRR